MTLMSRRPDTELELIQDSEEQSAVYPGISDQQEWHLHRTIGMMTIHDIHRTTGEIMIHDL